MTQDRTDLIDIPPEDQMGPAMLRLNPRQRVFVCALGVFGGDQSKAYAYAGYKSDNARSVAAASSRMANTSDVVEAIREEALRRMGTGTLLAVSNLIEFMSPLHNNDVKLRFKATTDFLTRTGFNPETKHTIVIKDERTTAQIKDNLRRLFEENKDALPEEQRRALLPILDAEFVDVPAATTEGIEDLF